MLMDVAIRRIKAEMSIMNKGPAGPLVVGSEVVVVEIVIKSIWMHLSVLG